MSTGTPPTIPTELQQYNSYAEDPKWQNKFTLVWTVLIAAAVVCNVPHLVRSIRSGRAFVGLFGVKEAWGAQYESVADEEGKGERLPPKRPRRLPAILRALGSIVLWSPPGIELNAGQILTIGVYLATVIACIVKDAPLTINPNRAGFMAVAQLPVVFLFATKNSILSLLLGPGHGYEKLNYIHRWSGRGMFLAGVVHGGLWIQDHLHWDEPIIGPQKETSGVAAMALLCVIVLGSLKPVRKMFYEVFFIIHILTFVAFFVTVCYHTQYATPWIIPPLALYGMDMLMRMLRFRIKDAYLSCVDNQLTTINVPDCTSGWSAGQFVRLRVFFHGRVFESHPLTILSAPPSSSCLTSFKGITLGARVKGDWTKALNEYTQAEKQTILARAGAVLGDVEKKGKDANNDASTQVPVQVLIDGPYGGCRVDLGNYETVLLFAGGSGATFTIGMLDDIVGRCVRLGRRGGERTRRIEFSWCIRSFGQIEWFTPQLMEIALAAARSDTLDLHLSIYVTCLCNPEAIPPIPNCDVTVLRPSIYQVLQSLTIPPSFAPATAPSSKASKTANDDDDDAIQVVNRGSNGEEIIVDNLSGDAEWQPELDISGKLKWVGLGGGVAVCASGPETMTRAASNAVAKMSLTRGVELGGIALHTELFAM